VTRRQSHQFRLATVLSARASYVAVILFATIVEVARHPQLSGASARFAFAFRHPVDWSIAIDVLRNILLFAGLGAIWLVTSHVGRLRDAILRATVVGFCLSISVETLQVFTAERVASRMDVYTNTFGASAGALGAGVLVAMVRAMRGHKTAIGVPMFLFAVGQLGALLAEALAPLDRYVVGGVIRGGPRQRLATSLLGADPLALSQLSLLDAMLALPAGAFTAIALLELGAGRALAGVSAAAIGAWSLTLVEGVHGTAGQPISLNLLLSRVLGFATGGVLAMLITPALGRAVAGVQRARLVGAVLVLTLVAWTWRPFLPRTSLAEIAQQFSRIHWMPLGAAPYTLGLLSIGHVIHLASLGVTVGALLAVWPVRARGPFSYVWPAAWLAAALELGHAFLVPRFVDVTGFLLLFAGAWLGDAVVRRAGFTRYGVLLGSADLGADATTAAVTSGPRDEATAPPNDDDDGRRRRPR
jgi:hypothetical protein